MQNEAISKNDLKAVALLHIDAISTGFISTLGMPFVAALYGAMSKCPYSFVVLDRSDDGTLKGFLAGTVNTKKMYIWILSRYGPVFVLLLMAKMIDIKVLKKIFETLVYGGGVFSEKKTSGKDPAVHAELLAVAVNSSFRRQGTGRKLTDLFESYLIGKNISSCKVVTFSRDSQSNAFYEKSNFKLYRQFIHHGNVLNEYIKLLAI